MKVAVLDDWFDTLKTLPCFAKLKEHDVTVFTDHVEDVAHLARRLEPFTALALFRERTAITADLLERLPRLKLISQRSVYPHIDVTACTAHGVLLCSNLHQETPSYATAEHTWALIMTASRQIPQQMASLRQGSWQCGVGKTLRGRVLGLYGYGRIAKTVASYAQAFSMNILWWGSEEGRQKAQADGWNVPPSREDFFSQSDVISVHVRLKPSTRGCIREADLSMTRDGALFVNTSRAQIVEKDALLNVLNQGRLFAAVDVFDQEPITWENDPIATHPRVLAATPHIGFVTEEELDLQFADVFDQINAYANRQPIHMINPEVWQAT